MQSFHRCRQAINYTAMDVLWWRVTSARDNKQSKNRQGRARLVVGSSSV